MENGFLAILGKNPSRNLLMCLKSIINPNEGWGSRRGVHPLGCGFGVGVVYNKIPIEELME